MPGARVVVTGASRGIGAALATELAARGASVVLVARSVEPLEKLAAELGGESFAADLADASAIEPLVRRIEAEGPIDVLVNNAGVDLTADLVALPGAEIARLVAVNLCAPMLLCRAVIPHMIAANHGSIVNISTRQAERAARGFTAYIARRTSCSASHLSPTYGSVPVSTV